MTVKELLKSLKQPTLITISDIRYHIIDKYYKEQINHNTTQIGNKQPITRNNNLITPYPHPLHWASYLDVFSLNNIYCIVRKYYNLALPQV